MTGMDEHGGHDDGAGGVEEYAAAVRAELADLPADAVAELLEDLEDHLQEVAAEDSGDLHERLGTPAEYAAELRASAGLPERGTGVGAGAPAPQKPKRRSPSELVAAFESWLRTQWLGREFLDFLPLLRPAWWVVRAWLVVYLLQILTGEGNGSQVWVIPRPGGSAFLGMLALVFAIPGSVWLARRPPFRGRRATLFALGQGVLGIVALVAVFSGGHGNGPFPAMAAGYVGPAGLNDAGRPISNLYVYDQNGKLLNGVYVYDQNGNPISVDHEDNGVAVTQTYVDADGSFVFNRFPEQQARIAYGPEGGQHLVPTQVPDVVVPVGVQPAGSVANGLPDGAPVTPTTEPTSGPSAAPTSPASASGSASGTPSTSSAPTTTPSASRS